MMLTTKARYAVMAMIDVASMPEGAPITLSEISVRQHIDLRYLEQIFTKLRRSGIVRSVKGPGGGYVLSACRNELKIADIIDAVDENIDMTRCASAIHSGCLPNSAKCKTHSLWEGLSSHIRGYFTGISIADVINDDD